jgi:hypothetical protein
MMIEKVKFRLLFAVILILMFMTLLCRVAEAQWIELADGVSYQEVAPSVKSTETETHTVFYLKMDSYDVRWHFLTEVTTGKYQPADQWARDYEFNIVVNMGMFNYDEAHTPTGYTRVDWNKEINPNQRGDYKGVITAYRAGLGLVDKAQALRSQELRKYQYEIHLIRMIADGQVVWSKQPSKQWSTVCIGMDQDGMIYLIFSRSAYMVNTLAHEILKAIPEMKNVYYLEGGCEASIYVQIGDFEYKNWGSYESNVSEDDDNDGYWSLPNIIGLSLK